MGDRPLIEALLSTLAAAEDRERVLVEHCDDSPPSDPSTWTVKDHVAHLAHWRRHAAGVLDLARTAGAAPPAETIDEINARVHASNRDRPASEVKVEAARSFEVLRAAIEACTKEQLTAPRPGRSGALWEVVPGDGHVHTGQNLIWWFQGHGDAG